MLRIALTRADLDHVRVATRPAPLLELRSTLREPLFRRLRAGATVDRAKLDLVWSLVAQPCAPGFLFPTTSDPDDAVETVVGTRRDAIARDLEDNVAAGFPLAAWTSDLTLPGRVGVRARRGLQAALTHTTAAHVTPRTRFAEPSVDAAVRAWRAIAAADGARALLNSLHRGVRCRGAVLEVDLASGAEASAAGTGAGIRIVPTLAEHPSATVTTDVHAPIVLTCPVTVAPRPSWDPPADPALDDLLGPSRRLLLGVVGARPGLGVRELARRTGLSPASVSEQAGILARAGLFATARVGTRVTHELTPLGWSLLVGVDRRSGPTRSG